MYVFAWVCVHHVPARFSCALSSWAKVGTGWDLWQKFAVLEEAWRQGICSLPPFLRDWLSLVFSLNQSSLFSSRLLTLYRSMLSPGPGVEGSGHCTRTRPYGFLLLTLGQLAHLKVKFSTLIVPGICCETQTDVSGMCVYQCISTTIPLPPNYFSTFYNIMSS